MWFKTSKSTSQKITNTKSIDKSTQTNNSSKYVYANGVASSSNKYHKTATAHCMKGSIKMTETSAKKKCISCMRCVNNCPYFARKVNGAMVSIASLAIKKACTVRKEFIHLYQHIILFMFSSFNSLMF